MYIYMYLYQFFHLSIYILGSGLGVRVRVDVTLRISKTGRLLSGLLLGHGRGLGHVLEPQLFQMLSWYSRKQRSIALTLAHAQTLLYTHWPLYDIVKTNFVFVCMVYGLLGEDRLLRHSHAIVFK